MKQLFCIFMSLLMCIINFFAKPEETPSDLEPITDRVAVATTEDMELFTKIFETETAYLASLQLDNGAIPMTYTENGTLTMNPYFADFAALALLDNAKEYADEVKMYMDWHFAHLNTAETDYNGVDGTIYDYKITVADGKIAEETISETNGQKSYDSTDSYAATFLMVLNKYYCNTGDKEYIIAHGNDIERITNAMLSTLHNGLTFAKPDYEVKYLMDNSEVFEGVESAIALFRDVICVNNESYNETLDKCENASEQIAEAFETKLWNASEKHYKVGLFKNGQTAFDFSWDEYYPSATAQLFPIIHGVIKTNTKRANDLYDNFCKAFDWQNFNTSSVFCWGSNVLAAALMNDLESVVCYMNNYAVKFETHEYPLYNADAARVSMAAYIMIEKNSK